MELSDNDLKKMLYWMVLGRRLEEKITVLFRESRLRGHHHPGIGQEAANVGAAYGLQDKDCITLIHRGKLPELVKGMDFRELMAGYYAKTEGLQGGGGRVPIGSHMYGDLSKGIIPDPALSGPQFPWPQGLALPWPWTEKGPCVLFFWRRRFK